MTTLDRAKFWLSRASTPLIFLVVVVGAGVVFLSVVACNGGKTGCPSAEEPYLLKALCFKPRLVICSLCLKGTSLHRFDEKASFCMNSCYSSHDLSVVFLFCFSSAG